MTAGSPPRLGDLPARRQPLTPSADLIASLKRAEGLRLKAYPDPESEFAKTGKGSPEPWTIGYGHTGPEVHEGLVWTKEQADAALLDDIAEACAECDRRIPWWRSLDAVRREVLWELMFNMGWGGGVRGLSTFRNTLSALQRRDFSRAAAGLLASRYAVQVKGRAMRLAQQLASGERLPV